MIMMGQLDKDYSMTQAQDDGQNCPLADLFTLLSGPWTCLIIWHLSQRHSLRFLELKRQIGKISAKILTERLRMLESAGIIERHASPGVPQQVHYQLSPRGQEMREAFKALDALARQWGDLNVRKSRQRNPAGQAANLNNEAAE